MNRISRPLVAGIAVALLTLALGTGVADSPVTIPSPETVTTARVLLDDKNSILSLHFYKWAPGADRTVRVYSADGTGTLVDDPDVVGVEVIEVLAGPSSAELTLRSDSQVLRNPGGVSAFFIQVPEPGLATMHVVYRPIRADGPDAAVFVESDPARTIDYRVTVPPRPLVELQGLAGPTARGELFRSPPCVYYSGGDSILSWRPPAINGCGNGFNSLGFAYGDIHCSYGSKVYDADHVRHGCGRVYHDTGQKLVTLPAGSNGWTETTTDCITPPDEGASTYVTSLTFSEFMNSVGSFNFAQWGIYGTQFSFNDPCLTWARAVYLQSEMWSCDGTGPSCSSFNGRYVTKTVPSALSTNGYSLSITVWGAAPGSGFQFCGGIGPDAECGSIPSGGPGVSWDMQTQNLQSWVGGGVLPSVEEER